MKYTLKKGKFSSGIHFGVHRGRVNQAYKVRFDSSCLYDDIDWERDWNKLDGWSYSNLPFKKVLTSYSIGDVKNKPLEYSWEPGHHNNSLRVAWRANKKENKIELALYYYQDGVRTIQDFTSVDVDKDYTIGIFYKIDDHDDTDPTHYNPRITLTCTRSEDEFYQVKTYLLAKPFKVKTSYKLFPYFGGSNPAPQDMFILSEEKK